MCEVPAAQVQGGLGLSEVQAVPGLCPAEPLPEGQLLGHWRRRLRGLPAWVLESQGVCLGGCMGLTGPSLTPSPHAAPLPGPELVGSGCAAPNLRGGLAPVPLDSLQA